MAKKYRVTKGDGTLFCGITIDWDYDKRTAKIHMPKYIAKARRRLVDKDSTTPEHSPHTCNIPTYSRKPQLADPVQQTFEKLTPTQLKWCQEFLGIFLYYTRAVDPTMNVAVSDISTSLTQSSFKHLKARIDKLLNYATTHDDAAIKYVASQM